MKTTLIMATSANGIIATKSGSEDFLSQDNWVQFVKFAKEIGCLMWGRKTYEAVSTWDESYQNDLKDVVKMIVSSSGVADLAPGYEHASSPQAALELLQQKGFSRAVVTGGSTLNAAFAQQGLIDEVILLVNPVILGEGIPLFATSDFQLNMKLVESTVISEQVLQLRYEVKK